MATSRLPAALLTRWSVTFCWLWDCHGASDGRRRQDMPSYCWPSRSRRGPNSAGCLRGSGARTPSHRNADDCDVSSWRQLHRRRIRGVGSARHRSSRSPSGFPRSRRPLLPAATPIVDRTHTHTQLFVSFVFLAFVWTLLYVHVDLSITITPYKFLFFLDTLF